MGAETGTRRTAAQTWSFHSHLSPTPTPHPHPIASSTGSPNPSYSLTNSAALASEWGRLFHNWGAVASDDNGFTELGEAPAELERGTGDLLRMGMRVLGTTIKEAPEVSARLRRR